VWLVMLLRRFRPTPGWRVNRTPSSRSSSAARRRRLRGARVPATLSPELRLLTQAASPVPVGSGSLLDHSRELDWDVVLRQARRHRLASLLSRHLETAGLDVPSAVVAELSADRQRTAARNLRLLASSRAIVAAVDRAGVTVMALKGVALLEETYDDLS